MLGTEHDDDDEYRKPVILLGQKLKLLLKKIQKPKKGSLWLDSDVAPALMICIMNNIHGGSSEGQRLACVCLCVCLTDPVLVY